MRATHEPVSATKVETKEYVEYSELADRFIVSGLALLALEGILAHAFFRRLP